MASDTLSVISAHLKEEPFGIFLSVFELDEKSDSEVLDLIRSVLGHVDDRYAVTQCPLLSRPITTSSRPETPNTFQIVQQSNNYFSSTAAISDLLALVDCPLARSFHSKSAILELLSWLLSNFSDLKAKSRVIRFCARNHLPEALRIGEDNELSDLLNELEDLKSSLKTLNGTLIDLGEKKRDMNLVQTKAGKLRQSSRVLQAKIDKIRNNVKSANEFDAIVAIVSRMRVETEKARSLAKKEQELQVELEKLKTESTNIAKKVQDIENLLAPDGPNAVRMRIAQDCLDIDSSRYALSGIAIETEKLRSILAEMDSVSLFDIVKLELEAAKQLEASLNMIKDEVEFAANDQIGSEYRMWKQAKLHLDRVSLEYEAIEKDHLKALVMHEVGLIESVSNETFHDLVDSVRLRGAEYKNLKRIVSQLTTERSDLQHTLTVLETSSQVHGEDVGLSSLALAETQEKVFEINLVKESQLEEMSQLVQDLAKKSKDKSLILGPKLREVKLLTETRKTLEAECFQASMGTDKNLEDLCKEINEKRSLFDTYSQEIKKIENETSDVRSQIKNSEFLIQRADEEEMYIMGVKRHGDLFGSHYEALTTVLETRTKDRDILIGKLTSIQSEKHITSRSDFDIVFGILDVKFHEILDVCRLGSNRHMIRVRGQS